VVNIFYNTTRNVTIGLNLYFKPSVYEAKAVIKVKTQEGKGGKLKYD